MDASPLGSWLTLSMNVCCFLLYMSHYCHLVDPSVNYWTRKSHMGEKEKMQAAGRVTADGHTIRLMSTQNDQKPLLCITFYMLLICFFLLKEWFYFNGIPKITPRTALAYYSSFWFYEPHVWQTTEKMFSILPKENTASFFFLTVNCGHRVNKSTEGLVRALTKYFPIKSRRLHALDF